MSKQENKSEHWKVLVLLLKEIAIDKYGKGWQTHIADNTHLSQSNLSRIFSLKYSPSLPNYLAICNAIKVNVFFEDQDSKSDLNIMFERAMEDLGRRQDKLPKN